MKPKDNVNLVIIIIFIASIIYTMLDHNFNLKELYDDKSEFYFLLFEIVVILGLTIEILKNRKKR